MREKSQVRVHLFSDIYSSVITKKKRETKTQRIEMTYIHNSIQHRSTR